MSTIKRSQSYKRLQFCSTSGLFGTTSSSVDKKTEIGRIKDQFKELPELMKNHKINAAYNPNEHRNTKKQPNVSQMALHLRPYDNHCFKDNKNQEQNYDSV